MQSRILIVWKKRRSKEGESLMLHQFLDSESNDDYDLIDQPCMDDQFIN